MSEKKQCACESFYFEPINETTEYSGIEIAMCGKHPMLRVRVYGNPYKHIVTEQDTININYCPICRQKDR